MRLVTFQRQNHSEPGVLLGDEIIGLYRAGFESVQQVIARGQDALVHLEPWLSNPPGGEVLRASETKLLAPIHPGKIICIGLNYRDHALESGMEIPATPTIFGKFNNTVIGPGANIVIPKNSAKPDYEAEFAVVIGKRGRHIPADRWQEHVFGYTIVNDVSARDFQMATTQWMIGKTFDTFCPLGPAIVTADEIPNPHALDISMHINGECVQHSNTSNLIFPIPALIEYLSSVMTLDPGDIISTGTPSGVGFARKPPRWLKAGDECVVTVQGLGELRNPVVAEE